MPTLLPDRRPAEPGSPDGAAWIAGILAVGVLIGLTLRAPAQSEISADSPQPPDHFVRIVTARSAPLVSGTR